jgi:protein farnesyltransferase/geranylgeranyltransferase type-1 subunit alpha
MDLLAEVYAGVEGRKEEADGLLTLLAEEYDPIRKGYWEYRRGLLGLDPLDTERTEPSVNLRTVLLA